MHLFGRLALIFSLSFPLLLPAQSEADQILLKNGTTFEGAILEYQQGQPLWLELSNGDTLMFQDEEIERIIQKGQAVSPTAAPLPGKEEATKKKAYAFKEKGLYNATYFATLSGSSDSELKLGLGFHNITGYQFLRQFGLGLGLGIDTYSFDNGQSIFPLFLEARGYLVRKPVSPYYSVNAGYGFAFRNEEELITKAEGGILIRGTIGLRLGADEDTNVLIGLGYQYQKASLERQNFQGAELEIRELVYNRIVMRVGLIF